LGQSRPPSQVPKGLPLEEATVANLYITTEKPFSGSGQKALVHKHFAASGASGATYHDVAVELERDADFKSRQSATRIAAYYLVILCKEGNLRLRTESDGYPANERVSDATVEATIRKDVERKADDKPLIILTDWR
jgi:hypothetical protein